MRVPNRSRRGTAMTEALLICIPMLLVAGIAPFVAGMFLDLQEARTEAHRDMFDKTHTMLIFPESVMENHLQGPINDQFAGGELTGRSRQHVFAAFPPELPTALSEFKAGDVEIKPPDGLSIDFTDSLSLDLFNEGFPNSPVEGWEFVERRGIFSSSAPIQFLTYAATIRSPWTKLGYPWVTSQDLMFEPSQVQSWVGNIQIEDPSSHGNIWYRFRLAEHDPDAKEKPD